MQMDNKSRGEFARSASTKKISPLQKNLMRKKAGMNEMGCQIFQKFFMHFFRSKPGRLGFVQTPLSVCTLRSRREKNIINDYHC